MTLRFWFDTYLRPVFWWFRNEWLCARLTNHWAIFPERRSELHRFPQEKPFPAVVTSFRTFTCYCGKWSCSAFGGTLTRVKCEGERDTWV